MRRCGDGRQFAGPGGVRRRLRALRSVGACAADAVAAAADGVAELLLGGSKEILRPQAGKLGGRIEG